MSKESKFLDGGNKVRIEVPMEAADKAVAQGAAGHVKEEPKKAPEAGEKGQTNATEKSAPATEKGGGKAGANVAEDVEGKIAKKAGGKIFGKALGIVGAALTAKEIFGKTSEAMASDDLSRVDKAVIGVTNVVGGAASFVPLAGDAAQHLLNKGAEGVVGEGAKKHLVEGWCNSC